MGGVVGKQAFNAYGHVGQPACGVDARAQCKAKVKAAGAFGLAPCDAKEGSHACGHVTLTHALQAMGDQAAVVDIEFDYVGYGA